MLAGCVSVLAGDGWRVVVPSRRHSPIPVPRSDRSEAAGRAVWVEADWSDTNRLVANVGRALRGPADLLVAWLSASALGSVTVAMGPLLRQGAPVVEVHDSLAARSVRGGIEAALPDHPTQQVVLGYVRSGTRTRWLTSTEITDGVLEAMRRALDGRKPALHQVGEPRPWLLH
jgi:NAD(P)-dependent dehydrogenase (short-subunit alcohol dehydrogenase family)